MKIKPKSKDRKSLERRLSLWKETAGVSLL